MKLIFWQQKERVSNQFRKNQKHKKHILLSLLNRVASLTILSIIVPIGVLASPINQSIRQTEPENDLVKHGRVILNTDSVSVLSSPLVISEIKPGESVVVKEAREKAEKAEAEARARAEAEARTKAAPRSTVARDRSSYNDPADFHDIYRRAEQVYGVDARLLEAIHYVETGRSGSTTKSSYAGATGPMQFLPSTWRHAGADGNGDGLADIYDVNDAVFGAANYLKISGYPDIRKALWSYNPSGSYYRKVMDVTKSLGM